LQTHHRMHQTSNIKKIQSTHQRSHLTFKRERI
jgi:hypothetical protein